MASELPKHVLASEESCALSGVPIQGPWESGIPEGWLAPAGSGLLLRISAGLLNSMSGLALA